MAEAIGWCDATINPIIGLGETKISATISTAERGGNFRKAWTMKKTTATFEIGESGITVRWRGKPTTDYDIVILESCIESFCDYLNAAVELGPESGGKLVVGIIPKDWGENGKRKESA